MVGGPNHLAVMLYLRALSVPTALTELEPVRAAWKTKSPVVMAIMDPPIYDFACVLVFFGSNSPTLLPISLM